MVSTSPPVLVVIELELHQNSKAMEPGTKGSNTFSRYTSYVACWIGTAGIGLMTREDEPPEGHLVCSCRGFRAGGVDRGGRRWRDVGVIKAMSHGGLWLASGGGLTAACSSRN